MDIKTDIYINQLSQNIVSQQEGDKWFYALPTDCQVDVLRRIVFFVLQAGARGMDVQAAIENCKLKATYTPCHLLLTAYKQEPLGNSLLRTQLSKILNLPENERHKSFTLLISLFRIADKRKRDQSLNPDKYWWHRNLSNPEEIEKIILEYSDDKNC